MTTDLSHTVMFVHSAKEPFYFYDQNNDEPIWALIVEVTGGPYGDQQTTVQFNFEDEDHALENYLKILNSDEPVVFSMGGGSVN